MKFFSGRSDSLNQRFFNIHVYVFQFRPEDKYAGFDLLFNTVQSFQDLIPLLSGDQALAGKHPGVGPAAGYVMTV